VAGGVTVAAAAATDRGWEAGWQRQQQQELSCPGKDGATGPQGLAGVEGKPCAVGADAAVSVLPLGYGHTREWDARQRQRQWQRQRQQL
jgi:hypothetical protein